MGRSWTVLGALGQGPRAPLLAQEDDDGLVRKVVLSHRAPPDGSVPADGIANTSQGRFFTTPYVPGIDVVDVDVPLPDDVVDRARRMEGGNPRLRTDGTLVQVGHADDVDLDGLGGAGELPSVVDAPTLVAHPLTGSTLSAPTAPSAAPAPPVPAKVRLARTAALTLLLGLGGGLLLARATQGSSVATVTASDAERIELSCGSVSVVARAAAAVIPVDPAGVPEACQVEVSLASGQVVRGPLHIRRPGRYHCETDGANALTCSEPSWR